MATPTAPAPVQQPPVTRPAPQTTAEFRATHGDPTTWSPHDYEDYLDLPDHH